MDFSAEEVTCQYIETLRAQEERRKKVQERRDARDDRDKVERRRMEKAALAPATKIV